MKFKNEDSPWISKPVQSNDGIKVWGGVSIWEVLILNLKKKKKVVILQYLLLGVKDISDLFRKSTVGLKRTSESNLTAVLNSPCC